MKEDLVNNGSEKGVIAYFCECGLPTCRTWGIEKEKIRQVEELHRERNKIHREYMRKMIEFSRKEAKILGMEFIEELLEE